MTIVYNVYISAGIPSWLQPVGNELIKMEGYYFTSDEEIKLFIKKCKKYIKSNNDTSEKIYLTERKRKEKGYITIHNKNLWNNDMIRICYLKLQGEILFSDRGLKVYPHKFLLQD